jgi:hypothetical protein
MDIVLIHGMGRTPASMLILKRRLTKLGHRTHLFGYAAFAENLEGVSTRLVRRIERLVGTRAYAVIGHSLGSVILRRALAGLAANPPRHCFFLAPPMRACKAARHFSRFRLYRALTGEMGSLLADEAFMQSLPLPPNTVIYAGTAGPRANWLPFGNKTNDGILALEEMASEGCEQIAVAASHTFIMNSRTVLDDIVRRLATPAAVASR